MMVAPLSGLLLSNSMRPTFWLSRQMADFTVAYGAKSRQEMVIVVPGVMVSRLCGVFTCAGEMMT